MAGGLLVFVEQRGGVARKAGLEALGQARRMAEGGAGPVTAVVVGSGLSQAGAQAAQGGADRVLIVDRSDLAFYAPGAYAGALAAAAALIAPDAILIPASATGRDLAPRLAARLNWPIAPDLVELKGGGGRLEGRRPVYSGKAIASFEVSCPVVVTLRPNVFEPAPPTAPAAKIETLEFTPSPADLASRVVEMLAPEAKDLDVAEATIIVSGGRGLKGPENFALVRDLAEALGGAVGASRAVVDAGWIGHEHQVGQTGKVVSPPLYIACGISGAIQHLAGMSSSRVIVAINKDPEAPIFKVASYGIVGDLFEVLPRLTEAVRKLRSS